MVLETLVGPGETTAEAEAKVDTAELAQGEGEKKTTKTAKIGAMIVWRNGGPRRDPWWRRAAKTR